MGLWKGWGVRAEGGPGDPMAPDEAWMMLSNPPAVLPFGSHVGLTLGRSQAEGHGSERPDPGSLGWQREVSTCPRPHLLPQNPQWALLNSRGNSHLQ